MTMRVRMKRLEAAVRRQTPVPRPARLTEEDWLELSEAWGSAGVFSAEPDFPKALAFYRDALVRAKAQADPPFDPPADFMANMADLPELRLLNWRTRERFPDVHTGWWWLSEMRGRLTDGTPPVTETEFGELADWFAANDKRLYQLSLPSQVFDLGGGRKTSSANLRWGLACGPRALRSGLLAEDVRRLKALYGEGRL
jgi:hypothetical protein